jgi:hypothetical protein
MQRYWARNNPPRHEKSLLGAQTWCEKPAAAGVRCQLMLKVKFFFVRCIKLCQLDFWDREKHGRPTPFRERAILNFTPCPRGWTWHPGVKFVPQGECSPHCSPPGVNTLYCLEEWRGEQRISPLRDNFTPSGKNSHLGDNFSPGVKICP